MSERGAFNRAARRSGGNRPARFNLPNLSKDDLEILQQEALIRREFGEEGVTRFWDRMEELNAPAYSQASELDADDYDAEFRKKQERSAMSDARQETCLTCKGKRKFSDNVETGCPDRWHTLPPQGAAPNCHLCRGWVGNTSCEVCHGTGYEPAVPPVSRCVMCETGKTENGQPVFQKPELVDIRGEKLWRHKWVADQMFCTTCAVPPVPASKCELCDKKAGVISALGDSQRHQRCEDHAYTVPADPRSAEQYRSNLNIPELLNENATLRDQLAAEENAVAQFAKKLTHVEAALLSAQKEIVRLTKELHEIRQTSERRGVDSQESDSVPSGVLRLRTSARNGCDDNEATEGDGPRHSSEPQRESDSAKAPNSWEGYWASLGEDEREKLEPHIDAIRHWFCVGLDWARAALAQAEGKETK